MGSKSDDSVSLAKRFLIEQRQQLSSSRSTTSLPDLVQPSKENQQMPDLSMRRGNSQLNIKSLTTTTTTTSTREQLHKQM